MYDRDAGAMHSEEEPFLSNHEKTRDGIEKSQFDSTLGFWEGAGKKKWAIHLVLIIFYTLSSVAAIHILRGITTLRFDSGRLRGQQISQKAYPISIQLGSLDSTRAPTLVHQATIWTKRGMNSSRT